MRNLAKVDIQVGDPVDVKLLQDSRWNKKRAFEYMERFKEVKGCNYVPARDYSVNEMFVDFDEAIIRRELGWAQNIGLNSIRVWTPYFVYQIDKAGFFARFDKLLEICEGYGISVMPMTNIYSVRDPEYDPNAPGAQKEPIKIVRPGVHHSVYRYPGLVSYRRRWPRAKPGIKDFIQTLLSRYANDSRIILWDLYNEAPENARPMIEYLFKWAREVNPSQPLSVCWYGHDLSDVITFHTYTVPGYPQPNSPPGHDLDTELQWALEWERPMLCTECLARTHGNTFERFLPVFARHHIGWYVWGLCAGTAQYHFPWNWPVGSPEPKQWFHCLLYPDGMIYREDEIVMIRDFKFLGIPENRKTQQEFSQRPTTNEV